MRGFSERREDAELDSALEAIDIELLLEQEGIDYRTSHGTRGLQFNLRECPSCREEGFKTYVNAETGFGNCFHGSCGMKFNRFKLLRAISGLSGPPFREFVLQLAQTQGWLPRKTRPALVMAELKLPAKTFPLPIKGRNLPYLEKRGIDSATAERFGLMYCHHKAWWRYVLSDGEERFMNFAQRVLIPVTDLEGALVSFQGRTIVPGVLPKYLFPTGYAVTGSHLYNGARFEDGITTHAVVGEGAFDAIAIDQALDGRSDCTSMLALATFGMHLSEGPGGQLEKFTLLKARGLTTVTLMWDSEGRALAAAVKAGLALMSLGLAVRIARLPAGKDPNEVPASIVREAIFQAEQLTRLGAVRILSAAMRMS